MFATFQTDNSLSWTSTPRIVEEKPIKPTESTDEPWVLLDSDLSAWSTGLTGSPNSIRKVTKQPNLDASKRRPYPKRKNMGECPPLFGKVTVFVAFAETSYKT